jgi:hypothetical protein
MDGQIPGMMMVPCFSTEEEFSTQEMLEDPNVGAFLDGKTTISRNPLGTAEAFLHLFEQ